MSRTRAAALVLVNWKGVFYERYLLDRHVTALEGANGAGKTTVMIAAYVVLLPDMSRLRFTNLGETGATGGDKGIWGRLGESGRPAYAALDFVLDGSERLIAGVHLERKGEPSVEPTPFIVTGLADDVRLQDLMLVAQGDSEVVPELTELRESAARLGGRLQSFTSARDYFAALFELGVTPLRLGTDEERNKLNEMLRTSMTGGISRVLTSELRSFLLKEEGGLADTLQRMKANLDACRRTRTEVQESQRLEREIGGVFEAGHAMFNAAFQATRERADDLQRRVAEAETVRAAADEALAEAQQAFDRARQEADSARFKHAECEAALTIARAWLVNVQAALTAAEDVTRRRRDLHEAEAVERAGWAHRAVAEQARDTRRLELRRAQEHHKRAAAGLADLQRGLDELHRRAGAHAQVVRRRAEAETLLGVAGLERAALGAHLADSRARLAEVDAERRDGSQRLADASSHRQDHERILGALRTLVDGAVAADGAHAVGLAQLRRLRECQALAERAPTIARELEAARRHETRQATAREKARGLGLVIGDAPAAQVVRGALEAAEAERARLEDAQRAARAAKAEVERLVEGAQARRRELTEREPLFRELAERARRLSDGVAAGPLDGRAGHDAAQSRTSGGLAEAGEPLVDRAGPGASQSRLSEGRAEAPEPPVDRAGHDVSQARLSEAPEPPVDRAGHDVSQARLSEAPEPLVDRAGLDVARALVSVWLDGARKREADLTFERERLDAEARDLLAAGGPFDPDLLKLKDQLAAELLAASFEDVGSAEAAVLEARLGPLAQALVVDDPAAAAQTIAGRPSSLVSVWLVARELDLAAYGVIEPGQSPGGRDVLVDEGPALRVSRIPAHPRLGRRAREARAAELRDETDRCGVQLEGARAERRGLDRLKEDGEALLAGHAVWLAGDPGPELAALHGRIVQGMAQAEIHRSAEVHAAEASQGLRPRIEGLRALLSDAFLLDPPNHAEIAAALAGEHRAALSAQTEVTRCDAASRIVEDGLETLRRSPLSESEMDDLQAHVAALRRERDRLDGAIEAVTYVQDHVEALEWSDASEKLQQEQALVPALSDQLHMAEEAVEETERAARAADADHESATSAWQDADGRRRAAVEQLAASAARFEQMGILEPTPEAVRDAAEDVNRLEVEQRALSLRQADLATDCGRRETECAQAAARQREAAEKAISERREAEPAIERWERLRVLAGQHGLLAGVLASGAITGETGGIRGHVNLVQEAHRHKAVLMERLRSAQGGQALLLEVEKDGLAPDLGFADTHLELWLSARDWLRRRLPAQVAEVDDPREALLRLRDQLQSLDERLTRQETDLRGASEDVARGIDVQIRKAHGQVNRLNKNLDGVRFGSISGIRVKLQRVDKMEQVLRALREGAAQGLLFQQDLPIEEALDEIFRRFGGGRTGGQRLLDYREYVHLQVEIRRSSGKEWEIANPTRLSTGEAIGVGAALMMVVLTEWERDANFLRGKRSSGSLRFLFLDEANRLSHDNLGVLFDLCQTLDMQLLIAAPEVARAEGNTTYRLVRQTTPDGREEVLVTGRRTRAEG